MSGRSSFAAAGVVAVFLLGACGAVDTGTDDGESSDGQTAEIPRPAACDEQSPRLAVALPNLTNPYYVAMRKGFRAEGEERGFSVDVQTADDDDAKQLSQVESMLQKKPCALALNGVKSEPAAAIVAVANAADVPVFTVNVGVDPDALEAQSGTIVQYLGADNLVGGRQMAEQVLADRGEDERLRVGFVTEPDETPTVTRDKGFEEAIAEHPDAEVVARVDGNVKPDDSLKATSEMLSGNPDINVIFASTGPATYGALQALGDRRDVALYGFCAPEEKIVAPYAGCVAQEPESYGRQVVQQIAEWRDGATPADNILLDLKLFGKGETPAPGEVG